MRLTVHTDYSLRVLMYLAAAPERRPTVGEIAGRHAISRNHLMKVVHRLGVAGFVQTLRGQKGGLRLARAAREINLGEVVRSAETGMALAPCFEPDGGRCALTPACRLRRVLQQAGDAFLFVLDGYTLADLTDNRAVLAELLGLEAAPT